MAYRLAHEFTFVVATLAGFIWLDLSRLSLSPVWSEADWSSGRVLTWTPRRVRKTYKKFSVAFQNNPRNCSKIISSLPLHFVRKCCMLLLPVCSQLNETRTQTHFPVGRIRHSALPEIAAAQPPGERLRLQPPGEKLRPQPRGERLRLATAAWREAGDGRSRAEGAQQTINNIQHRRRSPDMSPPRNPQLFLHFASASILNGIEAATCNMFCVCVNRELASRPSSKLTQMRTLTNVKHRF